MKLPLLFVSILVHLLAFAQEQVDIDTSRYSAQQLRDDFMILTNALEEHHPSPYSYISKENLELLKQNTLSQLTDSLTEMEFYVLAQQYVASLGCGHTVAIPSPDFYSRARQNRSQLPFEVFVLGNRAFVKAPPENDSTIAPGTEILSIENVPIAEILDNMRSIQSRDGHTLSFVNYKIEGLFRTYYTFLYGQKPGYEVMLKSENGEAFLKTMPAGTPVYTERKNPYSSGEFREVASAPGSSLYFHTEKPGLAILHISSFDFRNYKKHYNQVFKELRKNHIQHLVIDLRHNGGGYFPNGNYLLRYLNHNPFLFSLHRPKNKIAYSEHVNMNLWSELTAMALNLIPDRSKNDSIRNYVLGYRPIKKNHYSGNMYVLVNGGSFSMSSFVAANLKHRTNARIIGSETGGGEASSNAILTNYLVLPQTQIRVHIPHYHLDHKLEGAVKGCGVVPHVPVDYTLEELLESIDKEIRVVMDNLTN